LHVYCTDVCNINFYTYFSTRHDKCAWGHVNIYLSLALIFFNSQGCSIFVFCLCVSLFAFLLSFSSIFDPPFVPSPSVHEVYSFLKPFAWRRHLSFTRQSAFFRQMLNNICKKSKNFLIRSDICYALRSTCNAC
jgi:hypothetical protein